MEYLRISWELLVTSMVFTYPTWTIIIPTLWIQSENVDIKMQVRDRHANEHTALKRLGGDFTDRKKGWRCSLDRISKVYRYRHQKTKLKIKFHLYIGDSCHQKIKKYVTWGLESQKFYIFFLCNPMEPFISGVRPLYNFPKMDHSFIPSFIHPSPFNSFIYSFIIESFITQPLFPFYQYHFPKLIITLTHWTNLTKVKLIAWIHELEEA